MAYIYDLSDAWSAAGTTFTAIKMSVTDTASAAGSLLMDLQVGGVSQFNVSKAGTAVVGNAGGSGGLRITTSGGFQPLLTRNGDGGLLLGFFGGVTTLPIYFGSNDVALSRDAANTLAQRNSTNPQAFNLYDTYTDASNYRRTSMYWSGGAFFIDNDLNAGTGITNASFWIKSRGNIYLSQGGGGYDVVTNNNGSGSFYPGGTTNTTNLGRTDRTFAIGYFGTAVILGGYHQMTEMTAPAAPAANGVRIYAEDDGAGKTRLMARFATGAAVQIAIEP